MKDIFLQTAINFLIQNGPEILTWVFTIIVTFMGTKKIIIAKFLRKSGELCTSLANTMTDVNQDTVKQVLIDANTLKEAVETLKSELEKK